MSAAPAKKTVDLDRTRDALAQLGLDHAAEQLSDVVSESVKGNLAPHVFLERLLAAELQHREERRIKTSLRLSGLPTGYTLGGFDWSFQPSIERKQVETLATCAYVREHATVLLQGPPGVGKTHLSIALGVRAIENGFSVAFYRLEDLWHVLKRDTDMPPQRLRGKKYMSVALLIVDEIGFQPLSRLEAGMLFRLVSYRYQRGSMILTTNKSVKDWPEILAGDEVMTTALLDRLLHRSHVLNIRGRSYRLRELEKVLK
jgi:DNA replication protein DnaC